MHDYFYGAQSEQFAFIRVPTILFTDDQYKYVSAETKILYGILLARMDLSAKNGWIDEERIIGEMAVGAYRAGAGMYITYFAKELAKMIWGPDCIGDPVVRACLPHSELTRFVKNLMFSALGPGGLSYLAFSR